MGKYFKYAIGEIVLVVIGILIALSINNWNTNRIQKQKESVYLNNIKRDLTEQLKSFKLQLNYEKFIIKLSEPVITYYKKHQGFKIDSAFTRTIGELSGRKTFVKNAPTYTELISSGNIDIISDTALKDNIIKYYQELERKELIINKNNNLYTDGVFVPEVMSLSELQIGSTSSLQQIFEFSKNDSIPYLDLNEPRLKQITKKLLEDPEKELKLINGINFRNFISIVHFNLIEDQKKQTERLLETLNSRD